MTIHQKIKARREALGLSMEALGALVGVTWQTVQQWEKEPGGTAPKRSRLASVAAALRTTPEYLLFEGDVDPSRERDGGLSVQAKALCDLIRMGDALGLRPDVFDSMRAALQIFVNQRQAELDDLDVVRKG